MGHKLTRMSYSSIIRESEDFGCVLCDAQARQLCESPQSTPLQSGPIPGYVRGINRRFAELGEEWKPGDVVMHNHPYYGASHGPDVGFFVPVFHDGELVGFSATTAHHLDIGALTPGLVRHRRCDRRLRRGPAVQRDQGRGGGRAQRVGLAHRARQHPRLAARRRRHGGAGRRRRIGAERFLELIERYGLETVQGACEDLMDYSERLLRQRDREAARTAPTRPRAASTASRTTRTRRTATCRSRSTVTVEGADITST